MFVACEMSVHPYSQLNTCFSLSYSSSSNCKTFRHLEVKLRARTCTILLRLDVVGCPPKRVAGSKYADSCPPSHVAVLDAVRKRPPNAYGKWIGQMQTPTKECGWRKKSSTKAHLNVELVKLGWQAPTTALRWVVSLASQPFVSWYIFACCK